MNKLRLVLFALVIGFAGGAEAACPLPLTAKDAAATSQNFATQNDANNNCVLENANAVAVSYSATMQSAAVANGNGATLTVTGTDGAAITINCSACSGGTTINFEGQEDGSDFRPIMAVASDGSSTATTTAASGITLWMVSTAGLQQIRARISAYSAGTITATAHAFAIPVAFPASTVYQGTNPWIGNVTQFGSNNIATGTGASGVGIPRVTISNDSSLAANQSTNVAQFGGSAVATGTGASGVGIPRVTISNDSSLAANQSVNEAQINGVAVSMGNGVTGTGVQRVTISSDSTGQTAIAAGSQVQNIPGTSGGALTCFLSSAATTNATNCKASAGQIYMLRPINTTTTIYYLRTYNLAAAPTCSSATGYVETIPVPPAATTGLAGGLVASESFGQTYSTGIGFCLTGGGSSTDNTNAATGVYVTILYK